MHLRIIDYVCNKGGGQRVLSEVVRAMVGQFPGHSFEIVGGDRSVGDYRLLLGRLRDRVQFTAITPDHRVTSPLDWVLKKMWRYDIPMAALGDCDAAWVPWAQRHRIRARLAGSRLVVTIHDVIPIEHRSLFVRTYGLRALPVIADELRSTRDWLSKADAVVTSSEASLGAIRACTHMETKIKVIPLSGAHAARDPSNVREEFTPDLSSRFPWTSEPYVLFPAHTAPSKNHERALEGFALSGVKMRLVLTGENSDLPMTSSRGRDLRRYLVACSLKLGGNVMALGYLARDEHAFLLSRATGVLMPTLAEGAGFPVMEALLRGVPLLCSDLPVLREQIEPTGGSALYFDPRSPASIAGALRTLADDVDGARAEAASQVPKLRVRTWEEVAREYWGVLTDSAKQFPTRV